MGKNTFGKKTSLLIGLIAFLGLGARAATWTGAGEDNLWSNPENWDGDMPPGCTRPKLKTDASQKLVYLSYHTPKGLMLFVR